MIGKAQLDELEIYIQLLQLDNPNLKGATYQELKEKVEKEFNVLVPIEDIYLLHEPTIEEDQEDLEVHFGAMFNIYRNEQYY